MKKYSFNEIKEWLEDTCDEDIEEKAKIQCWILDQDIEKKD